MDSDFVHFFFKWDENENTFWDFVTFKLPTISALMKSDDFFDKYVFLLKVVTPNPHDSFMTQKLKGIPSKTTCYKNEDELNKWIVE